MTTIQIGYDAAGNPLDYTTFAAFFAACGVAVNLPTSMTVDINVEVWYADASQGNHFDEIYDAYTFVDNGFSVYVTGMFGSFINRSCPIINQMITTTTNDRTQMVFRNLAFGNDETTFAINLPKWTQESKFYSCNLLGSFVHSYGAAYFDYCFVLANGQIGIYSGNVKVIRSIVVQKNSNQPAVRRSYSLDVQDSTIYSAGYATYSAVNFSINNSIVYTRILSSYPAASLNQNYKYTSSYGNCCFYQTDYPTTFSRDSSFEYFFGDVNGSLNRYSIIGDPKFVNTSGTMSEVADFALAEDSPCSYENRIVPDNDLFPTNKEELTTIGAWSYFISDLPIPETVFLGVVYDDGRKVGSFSPYTTATRTGTVRVPSPANVRKGVLVEDTVGTLYVPLISEDDVRFGVQF
jgi:hypothetical protein